MKRYLPLALLACTGCTPQAHIATDLFNNFWSAQAGLGQISLWVWWVIAFSLLFLGYKTYSFWFIFLPGAGLGALSGFALGQAVSTEISAVIFGLVIGFFVGWITWAFLHWILIWGIGAIIGALLFSEAFESIFNSSEPILIIFFGFIFGAVFTSIYHNLAGLWAAVVGSLLLSNLLGYEGSTIIWVAIFGFGVQWKIARARGEDVFRRAKPLVQKPASEASTYHETKVPASSNRREFHIEDFDPNQEMQVYDD